MMQLQSASHTRLGARARVAVLREMMIFRYLSSSLLIASLLLAQATAFARPAPLTAEAKAAKETAHEAAVVAKQAKAYYEQKQFSLAAELYRRAYLLNQTRPEFLYGVGRSEQMAGHLPAAREALENLRRLLPANHPLQAKAAASLVEMQEIVAEPIIVIPPPVPVTPTFVEPAAAPTPVVVHVEAPKPTMVVTQTPIEPNTGHAWTQAAMWSGGVLVVSAVVLAIWAEVDRSALDADLGNIRGADAVSRQRTVNTMSTGSVIAAAAGAGALALGLYWRIGEQAASLRTPLLTAGPTALALTWRF